MTKPIADKAEVALEYPDKFYVGTFERSSRFEAHLDPTGFALLLERPSPHFSHRGLKLRGVPQLCGRRARIARDGGAEGAAGDLVLRVLVGLWVMPCKRRATAARVMWARRGLWRRQPSGAQRDPTRLRPGMPRPWRA